MPLADRTGFTLIELLITMTIILILGGVTIGAVGAFRTADQVSGSARQVQSYISGARDRAIYTSRTDEGARARGVRLLVNTNLLDGAGEPFACTTLQYVESAGYFPPNANRRAEFSARELVNISGGGPGVVAQLTPAAVSGWPQHAINRVFQAGLLGEKITENLFRARVRLPKYANGSGRWYQALIESNGGKTAAEQVQRTAGIASVYLMTSPSLKEIAAYNANAAEDGYVFELRTVPLAGEDPRALPNDTAIDLRGAAREDALPTEWFADVGGVKVPRGPLDIMFDPSGLVTGPLAAGGLIHLPVVSIEDLDRGSNAGPYVAGAFLPLGYVGTDPDAPPSYSTADQRYLGPGKSAEDLIVTVNAQTGTVTVSPVNGQDLFNNASPGTAVPDGLADDPLRFAEIGLEAP